MADAVRIFIDGYQPTIPGVIYRMRAYDSTLAQMVYWESIIVDSAGVDYTGPGPLVDVVVYRPIGN